MQDKTRSQQYLTPSEEDALVAYVLRMSDNGFPVPIKYLRTLAFVIVCQRSSAFQAPAADETKRPPSRNWPQAFLSNVACGVVRSTAVIQICAGTLVHYVHLLAFVAGRLTLVSSFLFDRIRLGWA